MSMEQRAGEMVVRLSELRDEYNTHWKHCQSDLREYVTTTHYPIADRFEVWTEWCDKDSINEADVPLFGKMVTEVQPIFYKKHQEYDWRFFLKCFDVVMRERYTVTVDDVKELLIKYNFGSFTMDW